ncbi:AraC family transcriptional activator MxiE, partial [Shigella flexneri]|nr:AraC family transcriptional activator MxiE [Shigella flexneri]EFX7750830.1 helix-turn-helix domain-containing protein [Shigella sonnei]EFW7801330.1 helix-turn-helix domain-containing protein [Shigella flexneri]EFY3360287.1 AraC family transcriptional activator MxiE [Shigella flexneri]EFZ3379930.1 AraC family transcriptional activator MxiE [Shigella sonnei]
MEGFFFVRNQNIKFSDNVNYHYRFNINSCAKFLAFWDYFSGALVEHSHAEKCIHFYHENDLRDSCNTESMLDKLMLRFIFSSDQNVSNALAMIRMTESYHLVLYLLRTIEKEKEVRIKSLTEHYGVSEAYFRSLCRKALGAKVKEQLNTWRLVNGLLDVFLHNQTITSAAMNNGYASTSHFSNEIKTRLGFSARELSNI